MNAQDDLTFNMIGATTESPSQNPLLAYINQEFVAIKQNCLAGTPVTSDCLLLTRGCVGREQAHLSLGPLGLAEGSSTASLFLRHAPRKYLLNKHMLPFILRIYSTPYRLARVFIIHNHLTSVFCFALVDADKLCNREF